MLKKIPAQVIEVLKKLGENNFEAHIVGGCVRDLIMGSTRGEPVEPKDWDITTSAKPKEVQKIFPDSFYENEFGTVGVKVEKFLLNGNPEREHDVVEVTTYRIESKYSDKRRPDMVKFAKTLEEDLSRRDFTINAIALKIVDQSSASDSKLGFSLATNKSSQFLKAKLSPNSPKPSFSSFEIVDPYSGQEDIKNKIIRTVGDPHERFDEDALRMMRAIRFHAELGFSIEKNTFAAIEKYAKNMNHIALERIKEELTRLMLSDNASDGIDMLHKTGLLNYVIPELEKGVGVKQNRHHVYTIYKHSLLSLKYCPSKKLEVRLASLLHDIAKPQTKRGSGEFATFYNHDHVGARVARKILERLRFSNEIIDKASLLIDNHMFYYNPDEVSESSVRRLIQKVGLDQMKDLIDVRIADRLGSGVPKAKPYKLRHLEYIIEKVSRDAVSVKMLKINGNDLMKELKIKPGPKIGAILEVLLSDVIENSGKNEKEVLLKRAKVLDKEDLEKLRKMAKVKIEEKKEEEDKEIKSKYWVK